MSFFQVNGARLFGTVGGQGREPVICLHGLLIGSSATWFFPGASHLGEQATLYCYDLRGHGLSELTPQGYTLNAMAGDLQEMMKAWDLPDATLVGHSFGALVALKFACLNPQRVRKLVLVDPPYPLSRQTEMQQFLTLSPGAMIEALPPALKDAIQSGGRQGRKLLKRLEQLVGHSTLLTDLEDAGKEHFSGLEELSIPTLLVTGEESSCKDGVLDLGTRIKGSQISIIEGGHYLPSENTTGLMTAIGDFLDG